MCYIASKSIYIFEIERKVSPNIGEKPCVMLMYTRNVISFFFTILETECDPEIIQVYDHLEIRI